MSAEERIALSVPSRLEHLDLVQEVAERFAAFSGFSEEQRLDLGLAVREGAINAMKHAHGFDPGLAVSLVFLRTDERFEVRIRDRGEGFEPEETPDPTAPENILRASGRGLLLIRSLVDEVSFERHEPGMELIMSSALPDEPSAEAAGNS